MNILFARHLKQGHTPPPTPTNADRLREFRKAAPTQLGNGHPWPWQQAAQYAREAQPCFDYDNTLSAAADFTYGSNNEH